VSTVGARVGRRRGRRWQDMPYTLLLLLLLLLFLSRRPSCASLACPP